MPRSSKSMHYTMTFLAPPPKPRCLATSVISAVTCLPLSSHSLRFCWAYCRYHTNAALVEGLKLTHPQLHQQEQLTEFVRQASCAKCDAYLASSDTLAVNRILRTEETSIINTTTIRASYLTLQLSKCLEVANQCTTQ